MNKKKKQNVIRLIVQCLAFVFQNGYVRGWLGGNIYTGANKKLCVPGLNCYSCPGALGACPIGSLQAVLDSGSYKVSLYVFGFIGAVGVLCGRFVCGWLCPFGLIQDLMYKIPFVKKIKNLPGHKYLKYLRFVILILFVIILPMMILNKAGSGQPWFCEWICPSGTLLGGYPLVLTNANLRAQIGIRFIWKSILLLGCLFVSIIACRPFCKYVCPLGALYGLANPISFYQLKVDEEKCVQCGCCQKACGMDIKTWQTPNSMDCIRCGKCVAACPTEALHSNFPMKKSKKVIAKVADANTNQNPMTNSLPAASTDRTGKKICGLISGILCLGLFIFILQQLKGVILPVTTSGSVVDVLEWSKYCLAPMAALVPGIMMAMMGICLIIGMWKPGLQDKVREWPQRLLKQVACLAGFTWAAYAVISFLALEMMTAKGIILAFGIGAVYMLTGWLLFALEAIVILISYFLIRDKRASSGKKEKDKKCEMKKQDAESVTVE